MRRLMGEIHRSEGLPARLTRNVALLMLAVILTGAAGLQVFAATGAAASGLKETGIPAVRAEETATAGSDEAESSAMIPDTAEGAAQLTVKNVLVNIYKNQSDSVGRLTSIAHKELKGVYLDDILDGRYSKNAVACFLDHGYFTARFPEIAAAGLVPDGYRLPKTPYNITRTTERLRYKEDTGFMDSYVVLTDSPYLQTEQLAEIALYHGFNEYQDYEDQLDGFEEAYIPKYVWEEN